jgi:hypothetical protein
MYFEDYFSCKKEKIDITGIKISTININRLLWGHSFMIIERAFKPTEIIVNNSSTRGWVMM